MDAADFDIVIDDAIDNQIGCPPDEALAHVIDKRCASQRELAEPFGLDLDMIDNTERKIGIDRLVR